MLPLQVKPPPHPTVSGSTLALGFAFVSWPFYFNDFYLIVLGKNNLWLLWSLDLVFYTAIPSLALAYLVRRQDISWGEIGFSFKWHHLIDLVLAIAFFIPIFQMFDWNIRRSLAEAMPMCLCDGYSFPKDEVNAFYLRVYASISAGVLEEVIFRGLLFRTLNAFTKSPLKIVLGGSLLFAAIHWCQGPAQLLTTFLWGLIPGIWYLVRGSLVGPVVFHVLYDWLAL